MYKLVLVICLYLCLQVWCHDMFVGDTVHRKMVFHQRVKQFAIPFKKRTSTIYFADQEKRVIKGISIKDNDFSHATANIMEGGVGTYYTTIYMKSQRSYPLNYEVEIYV